MSEIENKTEAVSAPVVEPKVKQQDGNTQTAGIYTKNFFTEKIILSFDEVGGNIANIIEQKLKRLYEGKCGSNGYVKPDSIRLLKFSSGDLYANKVRYDVAYECLICNPVEGMNIECIVQIF